MLLCHSVSFVCVCVRVWPSALLWCKRVSILQLPEAPPPRPHQRPHRLSQRR
ncbi:hypothetical protein CPAR01_10161 [Colletotrichum paranaense]|uniref:Secreted protein n=3 Tax=Colletotrichum acutatum species complex TaxID=2707335 RepID=A0AAI9YF05_9PEZI|nr:uncharacterized protein CCOS01_16876 [Colletotrichum costaricense]XP_060346606.1 uncharacterized protein CPAR01_10161 [Colletotrichum paranaense]XP_060379733.1 uncharacterized protein CTAM01_09646 [Colletotrichum tamarilloi]KAI3527107.1 hypothetical protein CSPX01_17234 [Colletotrichum filicis]KAK1493019.1 hypothetical protein CTAM01_09646 [Colletotrichum tamarilloi]KAK1504424.1 hypothetical protein CCOS01_16876 [Colletotrichum costaricense]KAK1533453.1 hypothetical protein CPAR01_10161 [C